MGNNCRCFRWYCCSRGRRQCLFLQENHDALQCQEGAHDEDKEAKEKDAKLAAKDGDIEKLKKALETAADKLVKEIFGVKSEETVIITADDDSDASVVEAVKNSAKNAGAHAMVISVPTPGGVGKAADPGCAGRKGGMR